MRNENTNKRLVNQNTILRTLHFEGPLQRSNLSELCGIRKSSVTNITADLIANGLLKETEPGRYRSPVALNTDDFSVITAAIGPHAITLASVNLAGTITDIVNHPLKGQQTPPEIITLLSNLLKSKLVASSQNTLGIGVTIPGIINPVSGYCVRAVNLYQWKEIALGEELSRKLKMQVLVDNDVRCQLQACTWFKRLGRDAENILYIFVHDGVSCALTSHGRLIIGARFSAGEIGHTKAGDEGRRCACGRMDCLETYCSLPAIIDEIKTVRPDLQLNTAAEIAVAAKTEPAIDNILDRIAIRLARSLTGIVAATDPATLILGTANQDFSECIRPHLRRHLYSEMIGLDAGDAKITTAGDADRESLRGIAARVIRHAFRTRPLW